MPWARRSPSVRSVRCPPGTVRRDEDLRRVSTAGRRGAVLRGVTLERCVLDDVRVGVPSYRLDGLPRVEALRATDLVFRVPPFLGPVVWDRCVVDGMRVSQDLAFVDGLFRRCVLRGRIGRFVFGRAARLEGAARARWREDERRFYARVDWALDIREAALVEPTDFRLPSGLVRRDPATQVVVTAKRARARLPDPYDLRPLGLNPWATAVGELLVGGAEELVLAAPTASRAGAEWRDGIADLRARGLAEPEPASRGGGRKRRASPVARTSGRDRRPA